MCRAPEASSDSSADGNDTWRYEHMFHPWFHEEVARQRHQDLLAAAERYRLGRIVPDSNGPA